MAIGPRADAAGEQAAGSPRGDGHVDSTGPAVAAAPSAANVSTAMVGTAPSIATASTPVVYATSSYNAAAATIAVPASMITEAPRVDEDNSRGHGSTWILLVIAFSITLFHC